jgi:hypothetical protein
MRVQGRTTILPNSTPVTSNAHNTMGRCFVREKFTTFSYPAHALPLHNPPETSCAEFSDSDDEDRKLPEVAVWDPTPQKEKQTPSFTVAAMRAATKLLEQCEEYMTKSKDGRIPKRYDALM